MNEPHDPNRTVDAPSVPADALAGLAAGFAAPPESQADLRATPADAPEGDFPVVPGYQVPARLSRQVAK